MIIKNIQKSLAELYKALLSELRPDWDIKITVEDYNLYKLGFVKEIPCSLSVDISEDEIGAIGQKVCVKTDMIVDISTVISV